MTLRSSVRAEPALVSLILGMEATPAAADAFYTPPSSLPSGPPGTLVRAERTAVSLLPGWSLPATDAWRIMYRSTSATGEALAVTATLLVPRARPATRNARSARSARSPGRPLVSFAVGGHGMGPQCTPSLQLRQGTHVELAVVAAHLAQGWAAVVTDYQRSPGHTFLNAPASANAVLDAARAAGRLPDVGLSPGSPVGIVGYGHGGVAAAAAAERQPVYAAELDVRGVTAGGVPADLPAVLEAADGTAHFGLVPMVLASLRSAYPDLPLDRLSPAGRTAVGAATRQCMPDVLDRWAGGRFADLTAGGVPLAGFLDGQPAWRDRLDDQRIGRRAPAAPVLVFHGLGDPTVPHGVTRRLADGWRDRGADVRLAAYPVVTHGGALVEAIPQVHRWLGGRFTAAG